MSLKVRRDLARFRISAHKLKVETGRHTRPVTPLNDRSCDKCDAGEIEDEKHVILRCSAYKQQRKKFLDILFEKCPNLIHLDEESKMSFIFNNGDMNLINSLGHFVHDILN